MVMTIVPFNKRGRPWPDHGQFMVILWSTMVMDHDRPWSEHGRPWSDHDPAARACQLAETKLGGFDKSANELNISVKISKINLIPAEKLSPCLFTLSGSPGMEDGLDMMA